MKTITVNSIKELHEYVNPKINRQWVFRGQSNSEWPLESSLHRVFNSTRVLYSALGNRKSLSTSYIEKSMYDNFRANAHMYLTHLPKDDDHWSWLSLMQHHGAPTRLLDFTFSPYVALFFAINTGESDSAVYCIKIDNLRCEKNSKDIFDESRSPYLFAFEPKFSNERLMAQQGLFISTSSLAFSHQDLLLRTRDSSQNIIKIIIPYKLRLIAMKRLQKMNITSSQIYPGLDRFCKSFYNFPMLSEESEDYYQYDITPKIS